MDIGRYKLKWSIIKTDICRYKMKWIIKMNIRRYKLNDATAEV